MADAFKHSKWIWHGEPAIPDSYAEFAGSFSHKNDKRVYLMLSFDSICNVFINGKLVYFKQCADYPHYKLYDKLDITDYCSAINEIRFEIWYLGDDSSVYFKSEPGLIFEVTEGESVILSSDENILSRQDIRYKNGYQKKITNQLGYSFLFDNTIENHLPFNRSVEIFKKASLYPSKLKQLELLDPCGSTIISESDGNIICDLGREEAGFLSIDIYSSVEQIVTVAFGEHIKDKNVRQLIGERDFSMEIRLKKGRNVYKNCLRRIAARYLSIYFDKRIDVDYLGIIPVVYPAKIVEFDLENSLQQSIYDTCVRTLRLCMHEHYEDCPWREQALYVMDSRNQMLCGYHCFGEYEYARHNLLLISHGLKENGLLELTYPAQNTPAIPFFSLMYPIAVYEYIQYSSDHSVLDEVKHAIKSIMNVFLQHIDENYLIANLPYPFWNFYEWSDGSSNENEIFRTDNELCAEQYDLILNCAYLLACEYCDKLFDTNTDNSKMKAVLREKFFDSESCLFRATIGKELFTELGNSLAILCGLCTVEEVRYISEMLMFGDKMVDVTLSMQCFKYDALLKIDEKHIDYVISDIEKNYGYMLSNGATSVWETMLGEADFDGAGSLCHGWSAMPIYYLHKLGN